jgi:quercetin dioxygenase-like cupin family protein
MVEATQTAGSTYSLRAPAERQSPRMGLVVALAPEQHLPLDSPREVTLAVFDGVLYVTVGDDDYVLMPGDSVSLRAGARARAWNAGDDPARVIVERR